MPENRLQAFPAGELPYAALLAQLPVAVGGQVGITIPALYGNLLADPEADTPFAGPEGGYFAQALAGAVVVAAIGPGPNAPVHAASFDKGPGPVVVAIACRDPLMGLLVGTGEALPSVAAGDLGIISLAGAATAHSLIQGCFTRLTSFVQAVATANSGRDIVLTGHGTGGYFALALRCLLDSQVARAYAFDAPAHGLRGAFPPSGGDVDDRALEVRSLGTDSMHEMEPALGRRLLLDGASFGYRVIGPLDQGPGRGTLLECNLRRLTGDLRPEPVLAPLLSLVGGMPGQQPLAPGHPRRDLLHLLGVHLAQVGQAGAVLRLAQDHDGSVRIDIPHLAGTSGAPPAYGLRFGLDGQMTACAVPGCTLYWYGAPDWSGMAGTTFTIQTWDGGAYADDLPIDPATGFLAGNTAPVPVGTLLTDLFGFGDGSPVVDLSHPVSPDDQMIDGWRQCGAWIDAEIGVATTPDLQSFISGGMPNAPMTLLGIIDPAPAEAVRSLIRQVVEKVGIPLDALFSLGVGSYTHTEALRSGYTGSLISLVTVAALVRTLTLPDAALLPPNALSLLVVEAASGYVTGQLGVGTPFSGAQAWLAALNQVRAETTDIRLSECLRQTAPMALDARGLPRLLAGMTLTSRVSASLAGLLGLALKAGLAPPPAGTVGFAVRNLVPSGLSLTPGVARADYNGPAELLTLRICALADVGHRLISATLGGLQLSEQRAPALTLAHDIVSDSFTLSGVGPTLTGAGRADVLIAMVQRLVAVTPQPSDRAIAALLTRGWVDWLISAQDPDFRQAIPRLDAFYPYFDRVAAAQMSAGLSPVRRPVPGTDAAILEGLLLELRRLASAVLADSSLLDPVFEALIGLAGDFEAIALEMGVPSGTLPAFPTSGTQTQRIQQWLDATEGMDAIVLQYAITSGDGVVPPPSGFMAVASASPLPLIDVSWNPLGPGQSVLVQWRASGIIDWQGATLDLGILRHTISSLIAGRVYEVRVARRRQDGRTSQWTPMQSVTVPTGLEGARVARLELSQQGTDTTWEGRDVQINWSGIFPAVAGGSSAFATSSVPATSPHMQGYGIRILTSDGRLLREVGPVLETGYTYRYEDNVADSRVKGLPSASRELRFEVSILPKVGPAVGMQSLTVTNDAPPKVGVVAAAGVGLLSVEVTPVADLDLDGYAIWISDQPGFDPASLAPTYRGPSPHLVQRNLVIGNWYIRGAAVDLFQPRDGLDVAGLNLSDEVMVTLADITVDKVPPAVPTGLTLSSVVGFTSGGEQVVTLTATWDRNGEADFLVYEGQIRRSAAGEWTDFSLGLPATGAPSHVWRVEAGTPYAVRLRGRDRSGNASDYGVAVSITSAVDTTPPGPLSDVLADVGLRSVILRWSNPPDLDLDMVEVFRAAANDRVQALRIGSVRGSVFADQGLSPGSTWHYWLRAVDRTGNAGDWSHGDTDGLAVAIPRATADDIADAQLNFAKFAQGIEPVGMVDSLPTPAGYTGPRTVMLTGDGKLYRLVADAWTAAVAARDVAGQLAADQIAADAITAGKIAAGAVNAREIAAGAVNADRIAAGAILADHITTNAIRAEHIQAGAVTADRISVANLAAVSANLGTITAGSLGVNVAYAGQIEAGQIKAGTVLSDSITVGGTALGAIRANASLGASDPAARINSGTTTINGGKITTGSIDTTQITVFSSQYRIGNLKFRATRRTTPDNLNNLVIEWGALSNGTFSDGHIQMADANGVFANVPIRRGLGYGTIGTPIYVYWNQTDTLYLTPHLGEVNAQAILLATFRDIYDDVSGPSSLSGPLPTALKVVGNDVRAGQVSSRIVSTGELVADEIRIGPTATGYPGIYLRKSESTTYAQRQPNGTVLNIPVEQRSLFCYDGVRRRAQIFQHQYDSGFEAWDAAGSQIFGSNGFGTGSVDTRVLRPESATFVRSAVGRPSVTVTVNIGGLQAGNTAKIVIFANGNGDGPEVNALLHARGPGLDSGWNATANNYIGFKRDAQGVLVREVTLAANGTYSWNSWCSIGTGTVDEVAAAVNTPLSLTIGLIIMVSMR